MTKLTQYYYQEILTGKPNSGRLSFRNIWEIIKGRKFECFDAIASQRPSDISSTIISQLHNYFLHRLINNNDILAVEKTISYLDKLSFEYLPILPTGTCILAGLTAQVPVVIDIGKIEDEHETNEKTRSLIKNWK
ncbi:MAG: ATP-binding protein [Bacteroidales bacterium]|nr:ATP-binding protein [Bacteroidales bacterium]